MGRNGAPQMGPPGALDLPAGTLVGGVPINAGGFATVAALQALTPSGPAVGTVRDPLRGGAFVWTPGDLSVEVAADTLEGVYVAPASDPTGASGAWVRAASGPVEMEWYGAVGDGATSDRAAFEAALRSGRGIAGRPGATYAMDAVTTLDNVPPIVIDGKGATFRLLGDHGLISAKVSYRDARAVSAIDNAATADLSDGTVVTPSNVAVLTVSSTTGYAVNDVVKVYSDDTVVGTAASRQYRRAEYAVVAEVGVTTLTLRQRLRFDYPTSPRVARMQSGVSCVVRDLTVEGPAAPAADWASAAIQLIGWVGPRVENVRFVNITGRCVRFLGCYEPVTINLEANFARTITDGGIQPGYLIHEQACHAGRHYAPRGRNVRHVYTESGVTTPAGSPFVENYGGTIGTIVHGGHGQNCQAGAFDTHSTADDLVFVGCSAEGPYYGHEGALCGFSFRGRNVRAVGCHATGGHGYYVFTDDNVARNTENVVIEACSYTYNPGDPNTLHAVLVNGLEAAVGLVTVRGFQVYQPPVGAVPYGVTNGTLNVDEDEGDWTPTLHGSVSDPTVTYTSQDATWSKRGRLVFVAVRVAWSAFAGGSGDLQVRGFPFALAARIPSNALGLTVRAFQGLTFPAGRTYIAASLRDASANLVFVVSGSGAAPATLAVGDVGASGSIVLSGVYEID